MNFFKKIGGALQGIRSGRKLKGVDISKAVDSSCVKTAMVLSPIRQANNGSIPNYVISDSYLLGFVYKLAGELLFFHGVREKFLFEKAHLFVLSNAYGVGQETILDLTDNLNCGEELLFDQGLKDADGVVGRIMSGENDAILPIFRYMDHTYKLFK